MTVGARLDHRLWLIIIIAGGVGLRLYGLGDQSLWADEGLSYWIASAGNLEELLRRADDRSFHPPLGFLINHLALGVQDSDAMLRLPSALLGALTIPLLYLLGRTLAWPAAALAATAFFAVAPFHLWHSQDARAYAPLLMANTASTVVLLWTLAGGRARVGGTLYALTAALGLYLHAFTVITITVHGAWLLLCRIRWLPWFVLVVAGALLLAAPVTLEWAAYALSRAVRVATDVQVSASHRSDTGLLALPYALYTFAVGYSFGPDVASLHGTRDLALLGRFGAEISLAALIFGGLMALGALALLRRTTPAQWSHVLLGLLLPLLLVLLIVTATKFAFNVRYVIAAFPYFCILVGAGVARLVDRSPVLGWITALVVIGLSIWSWSNYLTDPRFAKEDLRAAVRAWQADGGRGKLFSVSTAGGVHDVVWRYLGPEERLRHVPAGKRDVVTTIESAMLEDEEGTAHVVIARDWDRELEQAVVGGFELRRQQDFAGARLLEIVRADRP